ncbi:MAG TPA: DNA methyltransferase [Terriglobia bacterium]|nr:DNA methyltransferase [Terriglobia bacterium]
MRTFHKTKLGEIVLGDSLDYLADVQDESVDLIITSPPFGLVRKKDYGNVESHEYVDWFKPFGTELRRILKQSGSLVIDIGGAWIPGQPTRSLYHFELAIMLCRELGFYLAQEFLVESLETSQPRIRRSSGLWLQMFGVETFSFLRQRPRQFWGHEAKTARFGFLDKP